MNLDNVSAFRELDQQQMLVHIDGLPRQLQAAWELGQKQALPEWDDLRQVVISGMGGSAIGADLLKAYIADRCQVPVLVHRDYNLPAWARGHQTLVIASSHSGNTEETLSSMEQARQNKCRRIAVTTGGGLEKMAAGSEAPVWKFEHHGQPRAAVGFSFGLLLAILARLKLIPDPGAELSETVEAMRQQQASLRADVPAASNPAKRLAGQLVGRLPVIFGSDRLAPVAQRWKGQINEVAKAWSQYETLPEADHNTLAGASYPEALIASVMAVFLRSAADNKRNRRRSELTRQTLMVAGINTDVYEARGGNPLAQQWTALHFGDYTAYYLAMAYGVDPTPVGAIEDFKQALKTAGLLPE
jgi:glucose/mannose-6-phosphate isomerase